jgi:hypothetical protein
MCTYYFCKLIQICPISVFSFFGLKNENFRDIIRVNVIFIIPVIICPYHDEMVLHCQFPIPLLPAP